MSSDHTPDYCAGWMAGWEHATSFWAWWAEGGRRVGSGLHTVEEALELLRSGRLDRYDPEIARCRGGSLESDREVSGE